jgi:hypothetical protein
MRKMQDEGSKQRSEVRENCMRSFTSSMALLKQLLELPG